MTISSNSRYANSTLILVDDPDTGQPTQVITPSPAIAYNFQFLFHIVTGQETDRIDVIANNAYGDPQLWWLIADANPEIMDWSNLPSGTVIRIPSQSS